MPTSSRANDRAGPARRPPGMTDVARLAGVSQKTVSRVINGERYVSEDVRERVQRAIRKLGYRRNTAARALITGRFRRIGVVSLGSALYGPASLVVALERATRAAGFSFAVVYTLEGRPGSIADAVNSLLEQGVDGIVLSEPIDEGEALRLDLDLPVLSFGEVPGLSGSPAIVAGSDGVLVARIATEHLLGLGHTTVWHVAGPRQGWAARDRHAGWQATLEAAGSRVPPVLEGDWSAASGYAAGVRIARDPDVTAVFASNDEMAIGVIRALADAGRRVPEDVSVAGVDDIPPAAYLFPPLTTVRQDFDAIAARSVGQLLQPIDGPAATRASGALAPFRLIVRASTAPPPQTAH